MPCEQTTKLCWLRNEKYTLPALDKHEMWNRTCSSNISGRISNKCYCCHTFITLSKKVIIHARASIRFSPKLTWRDVQYVAALTANPKPFKDGNFTMNGAGRLCEHIACLLLMPKFGEPYIQRIYIHIYICKMESFCIQRSKRCWSVREHASRISRSSSEQLSTTVFNFTVVLS